MTKFISWNVNGIRAAIKKGFLDFVEIHNPDILCLQETKAHPEQVELALPQYPYKYWNWAEKKGYSGTTIFSKIKPLDAANGLDITKHDSEGRVITLQFQDYYLVNVYTPNAKRELTRLPYRCQEWDSDFLGGLGTFILQDAFGGMMINVDMIQESSVDLTNPAFTTLKIKATPSGESPPPE